MRGQLKLESKPQATTTASSRALQPAQNRTRPEGLASAREGSEAEQGSRMSPPTGALRCVDLRPRLDQERVKRARSWEQQERLPALASRTRLVLHSPRGPGRQRTQMGSSWEEIVEGVMREQVAARP